MERRTRMIAVALAVLGGGLLATLSAAQESGEEANRRVAPEPQGTPLSRLPIQRDRLENGLRIVLSPDRTVPTIGVAVYYDVGSRNEVRGRSGFAHLFEHMMFQGSENVAKGEHFSLIMNRGGSLNGTTSHDRTNYFETLPSNELALGIWLEADRMRSLAVTEENFENQRQVVMEEWRQSYRNQPYAMSFLRINELAYGDYWPYSHSTIGDLRDLENAPLSAVQEFWQTYYTPNNAVISISGDFDTDEALALIRRHFGSIPSREVPAYEPPPLAPQTSERTDVIQDALAELPAFHVGWHIPPAREGDHYALEMLSLILGDGESSRLYQSLVKGRELLQSIDVATDDRRGPDLFSIWAIVASGHRAEEARPLIYQEIERVAAQGVTERELQKAKNRVRSFFVFGLQSNLARAQRLAEYEIYWGNAELIRGELDRYLAVTDADIRRVASQYFAPTNRTVLDVVPAPEQAAEGQEGAER
jgi:zinc protease